MKIIYLHQYFKKPNENGGTRSFDLATSFVKKGIDVEVISTTSDKSGFLDKKWKVEFVNGVKINYLYLPYDNSFSSIKRIYIFILFLWHSLIKLIKTDGDLVLATSTPLTIGIPAIIKKLAHKTPYVFEVRDVWPEAVIAIGAIRNFLVKKCLFWLEEVIYRRSVAIVPLSSDMQESIITRFPQFEAKTRIVIE